MSRTSFVTKDNCPVRWKRLARWREQSQTINLLDDDRKELFKYINDLDFSESYYATNDYVNSVSVDASATVEVEATITLAATVLPANATNKVLSWTSSNAAVATVSSSGVVTGVTQGNCVITASSTDGTYERAACVVTVTPAE